MLLMVASPDEAIVGVVVVGVVVAEEKVELLDGSTKKRINRSIKLAKRREDLIDLFLILTIHVCNSLYCTERIFFLVDWSSPCLNLFQP